MDQSQIQWDAPDPNAIKWDQPAKSDSANALKPENIPDVTSQDFENATGGSMRWGAAKQAFTDFFGNDQNRINVAMSHVPGTQMSQDAAGRPVVQLPDGKRFYIRGPGLSGGNIASTVGTMAEFAPGSAVAGGVTKGAGLLARMGAQALAAGGTDAATQEAQSGKVDPGQTIGAAASGGGSELLTPLISGISNVAKSALSSDAQNAARTMTGEIASGASPSAVQAADQYGLQLTKGQKLGDFGMLANEEKILKSQGPGGDLLRDAAANNKQALTGAYGDMTSKVYGGQTPANVADAFGNVQDAVQQAAQSLKGNIKQAYGAANTSGAFINSKDALADLQQRALGAVNLVDDQLTPATVRAMKDLGQTASSGNMTLADADILRRRLTALGGSAANPTDGANVGKLKGALDGWLSDAMDNSLINGDQEALGQLKSARALRAEYGQKFESDDQGGKIVQQMLSSGKSPEELAQAALGASQVSPRASAQVATAVKAALTDSQGNLNQDAWDQFRGAALQKMGQSKTGEPVGIGQLSSNIKTMFNQNPTFTDTLFSPEEKSGLGSVANAIDAVTPKGDFAKSSGSVERLIRFVGASKIPFVGKMVNYMQGSGALAPIAAPTESTAAGYLVPGLTQSPNQ